MTMMMKTALTVQALLSMTAVLTNGQTNQTNCTTITEIACGTPGFGKIEL
jgi:hypothetical protein